MVTASDGRAAVSKPAYAAGDRWVYVLDGSLEGLPGFDTNETGAFALTIEGRVEVAVQSVGERSIGGHTVRGVEVITTTTGYLNGTFVLPANLSGAEVAVAGILSTQDTEFWEDAGYFAVAAEGRTIFTMDVTFLFTMRMTFDVRYNATTEVVQGTAFPLDVGQRATASLDTNLLLNTTVTGFGETTSMENRTSVSSTWSREVLRQENLTVEAGTFSTYRLNQSLGSFPGLGFGIPTAGANETAFWSNDVGYYAKRTAYANGTPVAEMRLKSYSLGERGWPVTTWALVLGVPLAAVAVLAVLLVRRRRRRKALAAPPPAPAAPPQEGDRAR